MEEDDLKRAQTGFEGRCCRATGLGAVWLALSALACGGGGGDGGSAGPSASPQGVPGPWVQVALVSPLETAGPVWLVLAEDGVVTEAASARARPMLWLSASAAGRTSFAAVVHVPDRADWEPSEPFGPGLYAARVGLVPEPTALRVLALERAATWSGGAVGDLAGDAETATGVLAGVIEPSEASPDHVVLHLSREGMALTAVVEPGVPFEVELARGAWTLAASASSFEHAASPVDVQAGETSELLEIDLQPSPGAAHELHVTGRVRSAAGEPVAGATVYRWPHEPVAITGEDGRYTFMHSTWGGFEVFRVLKDGYQRPPCWGLLATSLQHDEVEQPEWILDPIPEGLAREWDYVIGSSGAVRQPNRITFYDDGFVSLDDASDVAFLLTPVVTGASPSAFPFDPGAAGVKVEDDEGWYGFCTFADGNACLMPCPLDGISWRLDGSTLEGSNLNQLPNTFDFTKWPPQRAYYGDGPPEGVELPEEEGGAPGDFDEWILMEPDPRGVVSGFAGGGHCSRDICWDTFMSDEEVHVLSVSAHPKFGTLVVKSYPAGGTAPLQVWDLEGLDGSMSYCDRLIASPQSATMARLVVDEWDSPADTPDGFWSYRYHSVAGSVEVIQGDPARVIVDGEFVLARTDVYPAPPDAPKTVRIRAEFDSNDFHDVPVCGLLPSSR